MRQPGPVGRSATAGLLLGLALIGAPGAGEAEKLHAAVGAHFEAPAAALVSGLPLDVTLHLSAVDDAPDLLVEMLPSDGIGVVAGVARWTGGLVRGQEMRLPLTVEVGGPGEHVLGARVTVRRTGRVETTGAVVTLGGTGTEIVFGADPMDVLRLRSAMSPAELRGLGVMTESAPAREARIPRLDASAPAAGERTVSGQVRWRDPEGDLHPVRLVYVEVLDADTRTLLARTATDSAGAYLASVAAERVTVVAYSRDAEGRRVTVVAPGDPALGFVLESPPTPLVAPTTVVDLNSAITIRGRPGAPSADSLAARAFAVYDALVTYWRQAASMIGADPEPARAVFPASTTSGCGTTCYLAATREIFVLREDAFDWDVLGHEFFHFLADRAAPRPIDHNPGGGHAGGSAIGMPPRPGAPGRTRDEGMRLAWSEGLATFMSLAMQAAPPDPTFDFPRSLASVGDARYQDTEDIEVTLDAETPADSAGFGSPSSVLALLWDFFDTEVDGPVEDTNQGVDARLLWRLLTRDLPCDPCDRVDRVWTAVTRALGVADPRTLAVAESFAQNLIAPRAVSPPSGAQLSASVAPTFSWEANGDPSLAHRNDRFALVVSRDGFRTHVGLIDVPGLGAASYTPTAAEWGAAIAGSALGADLEWMVVGLRHDDPVVPEGWFWYSNTLRFTLGGP